MFCTYIAKNSFKKDLKVISPKRVSITLRENGMKNIPFTEIFHRFSHNGLSYAEEKTRNHIESPITK